ncbi:sensor histidine kinase [Cohnella sp. GCM10012308]|uniref:sensor histidine kinase n=1 Tax=Cohnella sp. GCM10012308 TaxID=3317329 RepID=UPI00360C2EF6
MKLFDRLTIFPKLVLTFMLILIPLVIISLRMNLQSERLVRNEITASMQAKATSYMQSLEYDFGPLVTLQQQYTFDDDINNLAYASIIMSNEQYTQAIKDAQQKLLILKNMSAYVADAFVNFPALDRKVSATSFDSIDGRQAEALNQIINPFESPFLLFEGNLWLSTPYPTSKPVGKGFTIAMQISGQAIRQSLSGYQINGNGGAALMSERLDWYETGGNVPGDLAPIRDRVRLRLGAGDTSGYETISDGAGRYYAFFEKSQKLGLTLILFIDEDSFIGPIKQYGTWVWWIALASLLVILLFAYRLYRTIHNPLKQLVSAFKSLEKGDLSFKFRYRSKDEFNYLYLQFNRTVSRLDELINEVYVQKYQVKAAELKQLQSQINPHFLYNSLFNLYRLAKMHEIDKVIPFTKHLGDYFKYVTKNADSVPLEQEVLFCKAYVAIQTVRFEDHIRVEFGDVPARLAAMPVPKLFLQPLIENCYHHGLEDRTEPGRISIRFAEHDDGADIVVEDDGDGLDDDRMSRIQQLLAEPEAISGSEGLRNVQQRIRLHFGADAALRADRSPSGGLRITVHIPNL